MGSNAAEEESTLIAIDTDQNSQHAVKWAVEHLFKNNSPCTLLHVTTKNLHHSKCFKPVTRNSIIFGNLSCMDFFQVFFFGLCR